MFEIVGGRKSFFQWDLNQKLAVFDDSITEVHFCNKSADCALVCEVYNDEGGARVVDVPNILLQANRCIRAYGVAADHTEHYARFEVISRSKPADYVYTETEVKTFSTLEQRMDELEATVSAEGIAQAVEDYLEAHPVEAENGALYVNVTKSDDGIITADATSEEIYNAYKDNKAIFCRYVDTDLDFFAPIVFCQNKGYAAFGMEYTGVGYFLIGITKNTAEINLIEPTYATKEEVEVIANDLTDYVDNAVNNIDIPKVNLAPYALKSEIPVVPTNVSAFANDAGYTTGEDVAAIVEDQLGDIDLPTTGGGDVWEHICDISVSADDALTEISQDLGGNYKKLLLYVDKNSANGLTTGGADSYQLDIFGNYRKGTQLISKVSNAANSGWTKHSFHIEWFEDISILRSMHGDNGMRGEALYTTVWTNPLYKLILASDGTFNGNTYIFNTFTMNVYGVRA